MAEKENYIKILNEEEGQWHYLAVKNYLHCKQEEYQNIMVDFIVYIVLILLEQKTSFRLLKKYVTIKIFVEL